MLRIDGPRLAASIALPGIVFLLWLGLAPLREGPVEERIWLRSDWFGAPEHLPRARRGPRIWLRRLGLGHGLQIEVGILIGSEADSSKARFTALADGRVCP